MRNCFEAVQKRSESICLMRRDKHTNCLMRRDGFRIVFYSYCFRNILVSCETVSISNGPYVYVYVCVCVCACMCMCVRAGVRVRVVVYVCIPNRFKASSNLSHNPSIFVISHIDD